MIKKNIGFILSSSLIKLYHFDLFYLACQKSDYTSGIQVHTKMVTIGNFSEISSFMPGLKTLMQISSTLKV